MSARWRVRKGRVLWWAESPDHTEAQAFPDHPTALQYALQRAKEAA